MAHHRRNIALALSFAAALVAASGSAQSAAPAPDRFTVPLSRPGQPVKVEVGLVFGSIAVEAHGGAEVVVESQSPEDRRAQSAGTGQAEGMRRLPNRSLGLVIEEEDNLVRVSSSGPPRRATLRLLVPRQTSLKLTTVNDGDITVQGVQGDHELRNTNGSITVRDVGGDVVAHTVNGQLKVTLERVDANAALSFATLNGNVDVTLPPDARGQLRMRSDNGEIFTDFDVQLTHQPARVEEQRSGGRYRLEVEQEVRGTINGGGPEIQLRTFNGNIYLRRRSG
jgi:hypothetical protein